MKMTSRQLEDWHREQSQKIREDPIGYYDRRFRKEPPLTQFMMTLLGLGETMDEETKTNMAMQAADDFDNIIALFVGLRSKLESNGFSEDAAEAMVVASWCGAHNGSGPPVRIDRNDIFGSSSFEMDDFPQSGMWTTIERPIVDKRIEHVKALLEANKAFPATESTTPEAILLRTIRSIINEQP